MVLLEESILNREGKVCEIRECGQPGEQWTWLSRRVEWRCDEHGSNWFSTLRDELQRLYAIERHYLVHQKQCRPPTFFCVDCYLAPKSKPRTCEYRYESHEAAPAVGCEHRPWDEEYEITYVCREHLPDLLKEKP